MAHHQAHALTLTWNGERGAESTSTAHCRCGWEESASSQREARFEYHQHREAMRKQAQASTPAAAFRAGVDAGRASVSRADDGYSIYSWMVYGAVLNPYDGTLIPGRDNG